MLSSLFIWENFAMTSTVRRITSTTKLNNARMNVSNARVSSRFIRYIRVAAPCICFVPWAALASCRPRPQQQLPVSAIGGGRCRCRTSVPPQRLRAGAPPPGHSLEKLSAVLPGKLLPPLPPLAFPFKKDYNTHSKSKQTETNRNGGHRLWLVRQFWSAKMLLMMAPP